ncbi:MAG: octanoyltransferase [Gemmatimonadetes bacterium]|nr:octanoyltransferase [Gemmatimonadota bacterium]MBI3567880.1 octanoyltransferase [Gemmatimonadota bacterium]
MSALRWRLLDSGADDGVEQMAVDAGLMDRARATGEAVLRVYAWSRPTLSFGRHEAARGRFAPAALDAAGVGAVRRPTGGRVLLHDHEVTYSVTAPELDGEPLRESYHAINRLLLHALRALGVEAMEADPSPTPRPGSAACFAEPNAGELVVNGRKLVGSAQVRERGALLQHGSILLADDQGRIAALSGAPLTPAVPAATLADALGTAPTYGRVRDALALALREMHGDAAPLDAGEARRFAAPHRARFASPEWTWRR